MPEREDDAAVATIRPASTDWTLGLVPVALVPLILWGNPLLAIIAGAGLSLALDRPLTENASSYGQFTLQAAIVLLGFNLDAQNMWEVSRDYAGLIALYVLFTLGAGMLLGRLIGVNGILTRLISAGSAICGATAIATLSPILKARADQLAVALAIVFTLNMVALVTFPMVGHWLDMTQAQFGVWSALAVHDTSSVVATAAVYGAKAAEVATTLKLGRTLWLIPLALVFSFPTRAEQTKIRIPGFIGLFILASIVGSLARAHLAVPQIVFDVTQYASKALIVAALFLIGMEFTRETVKSLQGRVVWHALLLWAAIVPVTLLVALNFA